MADTIARFYDESKNPDRASLPGVPLADIDEATFESYPQWMKDSIDALPFYRKTRVPKAAAESEPDTKRPSRARADDAEPKATGERNARVRAETEMEESP